MSSIVRGLFGGRSGAENVLRQFRPVSFSSPGATGTLAGNRFSVTRGQEVTGAISRLTESAGRRIADVRGLREQVRPGFGRLTESRVNALRSNRRRTVGNVREELAKRRVAGSSFALATEGAVEAEFAQQEDQIRAESFLQELDASRQLIAEEFQTALQSIELVLNQNNVETDVAARVSQAIATQMQNITIAQAQARASQEAGAAEFAGSIIGAFIPTTLGASAAQTGASVLV